MKIFAMLLWLIGIFLCLFTIFKIVVDVEIVIGLITISFGILAVVWTSMARKKLSISSSLRNYTNKFLAALTFILIFSVWHTLAKLFFWGKPLIYLEYLFITIAYLYFVIAAYQILHIGKEFGFQEQARKIKKIIDNNKK